MGGSKFSEFSHYYRLVVVLAKRDIAAEFKESALGLLWLILRPTLFMLTFTVVRGIVKIQTDGIPYALTSFVAISLWLLFASILQDCTPSLLRNAGVLKKMPVPRVLFPISGALVRVTEYSVTWIPMAALLAFYSWPVGWSLIYLPLIIFLTVLLALGLGLLVASVSVFKNDVTLALPSLLMFWMFLSPVIYPLSRVPLEYRSLYVLNPMVGLIEGIRSTVLLAQAPDWQLLTPALVCTALFWMVGLPVFNRMSRYFADVL